ncbi:hypothetical protein BIV25_36970 [Streptomyces sp. MUSC 14]|nr:hypothetical protein BIV25_36970 [Streptomyces sp. MUSC 14]
MFPATWDAEVRRVDADHLPGARSRAPAALLQELPDLEGAADGGPVPPTPCAGAQVLSADDRPGDSDLEVRRPGRRAGPRR